MTAAPLPMFPLGTVLFPHGYLPLHVFEPRYRELVRDCLAADAPEFGVVLIERGSEVGGGDVRTSLGTVARIVEVAQLPDGRLYLGTVGVRRVRVHAWLPDEPYPRAEVEDAPDEREPGPTAAARRDQVAPLLGRVLAMAVELGAVAGPVSFELDDDPVVASWQACVLAPVGPADAQALLAAPDADERLALLTRLLEDEAEVLSYRLGAIDPGDPGFPGPPPGTN